MSTASYVPMARLLVWKNTATSIVQADGSPLQLTGMSIDVTERERSAACFAPSWTALMTPY